MITKVKIHICVIGILITLLVMVFKSLRKDEPGYNSKNNDRPLAESALESKNTLKDANFDPSLPTAKPATEETPAIEKTDYRTLGRENIPLNLGKKTMMERIENGISSMEIVEAKVYPDTEILIMEEAYERLIGSLSFPASKFPIWGVDKDLFFVFSGRTGTNPNLVFKYGYAVKKENGRIYRWFAPQNK